MAKIQPRDAELAAAGLRARQAGQNPTRAQEAAIRRIEKQRFDDMFADIVGSIPQKHWREWSGRQTKTLQEQSERYNIPFGGATINLPDVVRALHDFFRDNASKLAADDPTAEPEGLELQRQESAKLTRLRRLQMERELLPRDDVRNTFDQAAARLRVAGESLRRAFGPGASQILMEAIDGAQELVSTLCSTNGHSSDD